MCKSMYCEALCIRTGVKSGEWLFLCLRVETIDAFCTKQRKPTFIHPQPQPRLFSRNSSGGDQSIPRLTEREIILGGGACFARLLGARTKTLKHERRGSAECHVRSANPQPAQPRFAKTLPIIMSSATMLFARVRLLLTAQLRDTQLLPTACLRRALPARPRVCAPTLKLPPHKQAPLSRAVNAYFCRNTKTLGHVSYPGALFDPNHRYKYNIYSLISVGFKYTDRRPAPRRQTLPPQCPRYCSSRDLPLPPCLFLCPIRLHPDALCG